MAGVIGFCRCFSWCGFGGLGGQFFGWCLSLRLLLWSYEVCLSELGIVIDVSLHCIHVSSCILFEANEFFRESAEFCLDSFFRLVQGVYTTGKRCVFCLEVDVSDETFKILVVVFVGVERIGCLLLLHRSISLDEG